MNLHEQIVEAFNTYVSESENFEDKGVKVADVAKDPNAPEEAPAKKKADAKKTTAKK